MTSQEKARVIDEPEWSAADELVEALEEALMNYFRLNPGAYDGTQNKSRALECAAQNYEQSIRDYIQ